MCNAGLKSWLSCQCISALMSSVPRFDFKCIPKVVPPRCLQHRRKPFISSICLLLWQNFSIAPLSQFLFLSVRYLCQLASVAAGWAARRSGRFSLTASCQPPQTETVRRFEAKAEASKETKKLFHICFYPLMVIEEAKSYHGLFSFLLKWLICCRRQFIGCRHEVTGKLVRSVVQHVFMLSAAPNLQIIYNILTLSVSTCSCLFVLLIVELRVL